MTYLEKLKVIGDTNYDLLGYLDRDEIAINPTFLECIKRPDSDLKHMLRNIRAREKRLIEKNFRE